MPKKIAVEEAFVTKSVVNAWQDLLNDGAVGEPGLDHHLSRLVMSPKGRGAEIKKRLLDLGPLRLEDMDKSGVDLQVIALTSPGVQVFDADTGSKLAAEANDILAESVAARPERFAGLAIVAPQAPKTAAKEIERAKALGLKGVMVNSHTKGEYLDGLAFRPLLEAIEALELPLYIHPRPASPAMMGPMAERHLEGALWGFQTETAVHALRMIVTGVFDRHPGLRIVLGHLGEGIPFWLDRIDRMFSYNRAGFDAYPHWRCERIPSEYFKENFWLSSSGHNWGPAVRFTEEVVGEERLMFAVDYPYDDSTQQVNQASEISLGDPDKFYELNARGVFNLD